MTRVHINIGVQNIDESIKFYTALFGGAPSVVRQDYAKWSLEKPALNFALSSCCGGQGVHHLGIQTDAGTELDSVLGRMKSAGYGGEKATNVSCCYSQQDKAWFEDPLGVRWEVFKTHGEAPATKCCA